MIVSKQNLEIVSVVGRDKQISILNNLFFAADGSTVAANGKALVLVGPVGKVYRDKFPLSKNDKGQKFQAAIYAETIKDVLKNLPRDVTFGGILEHAVVRDQDEYAEFEITDGRRSKFIKGKKFDRNYVSYRPIIAKAMRASSGQKVILNLKRLLLLLQAIERVCPDTSGELPVFIQFSDTGDILLRAQNLKTGQRVVATMTAYKAQEGQWLAEDEWEKTLIRERAVI